MGGRLARARSSVLGVSLLTTAAYVLLLGMMRLTGHHVGPPMVVLAGLLGLLVGGDTAWQRRQRRHEEREAGGPDVLAAAYAACRLGERPPDPSLAAAARVWLQRRARRRHRNSKWATYVCAAGCAAGVVGGLVAHRPLGYGVAVLAAVLAVAQPLNERSFTQYFAQADAVLAPGPGEGPA